MLTLSVIGYEGYSNCLKSDNDMGGSSSKPNEMDMEPDDDEESKSLNNKTSKSKYEEDSLTDKFISALLADDEDMMNSILLSGGNILNAPEKKSIVGYTPLQTAIINGKYNAIEYLLNQDGIHINTKSAQFGRTAIMVAAEYGDPKIINLLIRNGCKLNEKDSDRGWSAIHYAAFANRADNISAILDGGANIDAMDEYGQTALHISVVKEYLESCNELLRRGANLDIEDADGCNPFALVINDEIRDAFIADSNKRLADC
jgi:ankyrin repeat protein